MNRINAMLAMGIASLTIGITILYAANATDQLLRGVSVGLAILGMALCLLSYRMAIDDDRREFAKSLYEIESTRLMVTRMTEMLAELKRMNDNTTTLINELRQVKESGSERFDSVL